MHQEKRSQEIRKEYVKAFSEGDTAKMEDLHQEAVNLGLCINKFGDCDDDRCYCNK